MSFGSKRVFVELGRGEEKERKKPRPGCRIGGVDKLRGLRAERRGLLVVAVFELFGLGVASL